MSLNLLLASLLLTTGVVPAEDAPAAGPVVADARVPEPAGDEPKPKDGDAKEVSGMSVLGNQEAPKSLVIVPWKSSVIGDSLGIAPMLDDSRQPVDRDVFLRALRYYEIRSE